MNVRVTVNCAGDADGGIYNRNGGTVRVKAGTTVANNDPNDCAGDPVVVTCPTP